MGVVALLLEQVQNHQEPVTASALEKSFGQ